jgi:hypothetical protein
VTGKSIRFFQTAISFARRGGAKWLRLKTDFASGFNLIWPVQPFVKKYRSSVFQKIMIVCPHPVPTERGASRSSRNVVRGAMDASGIS